MPIAPPITQNMTIGNVYSIDWWLLEGSFASSNYSVTDSGSTGYFTATSTNLTNSVSWNLPSNSTQYEFMVMIFDSNGDWLGDSSDNN